MRATRIPKPDGYSLVPMRRWFEKMRMKKWLFHPEDDPGDIVWIKNGKRMFTNAEAVELRRILANAERILGDRLCDAAYPSFWYAQPRIMGGWPLQ